MISWTRPPELFRKIYSSSLWKCCLKQNVLLSFDDGPGPHTDELLNLSQENNIKFAFFILPQQAQKYPEIVRRIVKESHILGSHFSQHRHHIMDTKQVFLNSLNESVQKIEDISQHSIQYCRIPYGRLLPWQEKWIDQSGYTHVFWSLDSKDYNLEPSEKVINRVRDNIQSDDIVLFHDGEASHPQIVQIVDECLNSLNLEL
jgi:peptidoglycan/xylan/chitin deacetylase (PgdA/CDA1 family)